MGILHLFYDCWSAGSHFLTLCLKILCGVIVETRPASVVKCIFVKRVPDFGNPENILTFIVLDDLMDSVYSTKVSQLFTKGSNHGNIRLLLITQKFSVDKKNQLNASFCILY